MCIYPGYYAIAYRDPATGTLTGIDIDLSQELGAEVKYVETSFGTFIADLQSNKCDIGMFGIGVTLKRAQAVEFTTPYLQTGIYAVVRKGGKIATWADIDKPGNSVAVTLGSYIEPFMKGYLKNAKVVSHGDHAGRRVPAAAGLLPGLCLRGGRVQHADPRAAPVSLLRAAYRVRHRH